jgi:hypothetical protein
VSGVGETLPEWATWRCHDCCELFLPGFGAVWSSRQPDRYTHGGLKYCQAQAEFLANGDILPLQVDLMYQALVEALGTLQRLVSEADDKNWNAEVSTAVFTAQHSMERGLGAHKIVAASSTGEGC